jgi:GNAT superfamily N-acetyltransferase
MTEEIIRRPMLESDRAFVYDSWLRSYRDPHVGSPITFLFDRFAWMNKYEGASPRPMPPHIKPMFEAAYSWRAQLCKAYRVSQTNVIDETFKLAQVTIACVEEAEDEILGWLCWEDADPTVLHYLYVKGPYRHKGVAKYLLEPVLDRHNVVMTHWTLGATASIIPRDWQYNPMYYRRQYERQEDDTTTAGSSCASGDVRAGCR